MIRYDLRCGAGHGFDGWFRSSGDFDAQAERGLLGCPVCGSHAVEKALMAPAVTTRRAQAAAPEMSAERAEIQEDLSRPTPSSGEPVALVDEVQSKLRAALRELKQHVTQNSENVGARFPEIARKMHADEIEHRSIHGRASPEEARALAEEGVEVHALPIFPDDLN